MAPPQMNPAEKSASNSIMWLNIVAISVVLLIASWLFVNWADFKAGLVGGHKNQTAGKS